MPGYASALGFRTVFLPFLPCCKPKPYNSNGHVSVSPSVQGNAHPKTGHEGPDGGGWSPPRPSCFTHRNDPLPILQEAGLVLGLAGQVEKISPPPGFEPWTVQPVKSRYTNYAIPTLEDKGKDLN